MRLSHRHVAKLISGIAFGHHPDVSGSSAPRLRQLKRTHERWWETKNVVGLCAARKQSGGAFGPVSLQVLVRKKRASGKLAPSERIPKQISGGGAGYDGGIPTDVLQVGPGRLESLASATRPEHPGYNIGNEEDGSGTLCCVVRSRQPGHSRLGLSCCHVIGRYGDAQPGERVLMPSYREAEALDELAQAPIGRLTTIAALGFAVEDAPNNVDAATFEPDDSAELDAKIALVVVRPKAIRDAVSLGLAVRKVGYASEVTYGSVQALHMLVSFEFPTAQGDREVWFAEQIGISQFAREGDSGSLVIDGSGKAIGMHLGSFNNLSICSPIRKVLNAVGCDLDIGSSK